MSFLRSLQSAVRGTACPRRPLSLAALNRPPIIACRSVLPETPVSPWRNANIIRRISTTTPRSARYVRFNPDPEAPLDYRRWDISTKLIAVVVVAGGVYYVVHLERAPETGRWRFMDISARREAQLAKQGHDELLETYQNQMLPPHHPITQHVRRVVVRLLEASDLGRLKDHPVHMRAIDGDDTWNPDTSHIASEGSPQQREWTLMVVDDEKMVNAMAAFGNIVVFTGILPVVKDEAGLAAVIGHEIGHVVARHSAEKYSSVKVLTGLAHLLTALFSVDFGVASMVLTLVLDLPNSRKVELEADKIGLGILARACYDPRAAPIMQSRLGEMEKTRGLSKVGFLRTHPTSDIRIKALVEALPDAYAVQAASDLCAGTESNFNAFKGAAGLREVVPHDRVSNPEVVWR